MANNNITHTPNYNLATVALDQDEVKFGDFRDVIAGTNNSNMQIIDSKMKDIEDKTQLIAGIEVKVDDIDTRITDLEQSGVTIDTAFDANSNNAIANKTVTAKFNDLNSDITALGGRVTTLEQNGGTGGGNVDYTKLANAFIATTDPAETVMIQPNPNDHTAIRSVIIHGNDPPAVSPTLSLPNVTLTGTNLLNWQAAYNIFATLYPSRISRVIKDGRDCMCISTNSNSLSDYPFATGFKPDTRYTISFDYYVEGAANGAIIVLRYTDDTVMGLYVSSNFSDRWNKFTMTTAAGKSVSKIYWSWGSSGIPMYYDINTMQLNEGTVLLPYEPYRQSEPVTLSGVTLGSNDSIVIHVSENKVTSIIGGVTTNITTTANGQALLGLLENAEAPSPDDGMGNIEIQITNGAMVSVKYNRSISAAFDELYAMIAAIVGG